MRECHITRLSLFAPLIVVQRDTASETWVAPFRGEKATNCPAAVRTGWTATFASSATRAPLMKLLTGGNSDWSA
jgi:hypothetical protein